MRDDGIEVETVTFFEDNGIFTATKLEFPFKHIEKLLATMVVVDDVLDLPLRR